MLSSNTSAVSGDTVYVEDVFSTWLYTGLGSGNPVTVDNGIDLAGKGGIVWSKSRSAAQDNAINGWTSNARASLCTNNTSGTLVNDFGPVSSTGFTTAGTNLNTSGNTYSTWTFRKQPKFFDVVTYTGTGVARTVAHSLGSIPGCIIVKRTDAAASWFVYHRSLGATQRLTLEGTGAASAVSSAWNNTDPTSTEFTVGTGSTNTSGGTYVAYLFAHDAGGFGLTGTDNVISCGSFLADNYSNGPAINLGWEPQWLLVKNATNGAVGWITIDNMRGFTADGNDSTLAPNTSAAEVAQTGYYKITPTGFVGGTAGSGGSTNTFIYIAIRRGPMKVPTDATKVFSPTAYTGDNSSNRVIGSLPAGDSALVFTRNYNDYGYPQTWWNRLTGGYALRPYNTNSEVNQSTTLGWDNQIGQLISVGSTNINYGGSPAGNFILYNFKRAPSFFDEVCYTGDGGAYTTLNHNLGVAPELVICKSRSNTQNWGVWTAAGNVSASMTGISLNSTAAAVYTNQDFSAYMLPTTFTPGLVYSGTYSSTETGNVNARTYVAYLFATCAGVSKVFSFTGNGSSQTINCGFTGGARWIMIKRTDSTGDWYIWDSSRGITSGNDPHLSLNTTAAEVTSDDTIDTDSTGFIVNQLSATNVNVTSATYIGIAIA